VRADGKIGTRSILSDAGSLADLEDRDADGTKKLELDDKHEKHKHEKKG
jgi:hypothetical protein